MLPAGAEVPVEGPCRAVDFELEMVSNLLKEYVHVLFTRGQDLDKVM